MGRPRAFDVDECFRLYEEEGISPRQLAERYGRHVRTIQVLIFGRGPADDGSGSVGRELMKLASERHLDDLDAGGYPDASATELLNAPDYFVPVAKQVLYSSLAGAR